MDSTMHRMCVCVSSSLRSGSLFLYPFLLHCNHKRRPYYARRDPRCHASANNKTYINVHAVTLPELDGTKEVSSAGTLLPICQIDHTAH